MSSSPLVSVVIPTYNRADLLPAAVESVLAQNYRNIEVVVVDDYSTDNTREAVARLAAQDRRVRAVHNQSNLGNALARNTGVEQSAGEVIAFLDDDSVYLPHKIDEQLSILLDASIEPDMVYSNMWLEHVGGKCAVSGGLASKLITDADVFRGDYTVLGVTNWMCRRPFFESMGGFDRALSSWVDMDFVFRAFTRGCRIYFLNQPLLINRRTTGISTLSAEYLNRKAMTVSKNMGLLKKHPRYLSRIYYSFGKDYDTIHEYRSAGRFYWQAWWHDPMSFRYIGKALESARRSL